MHLKFRVHNTMLVVMIVFALDNNITFQRRLRLLCLYILVGIFDILHFKHIYAVKPALLNTRNRFLQLSMYIKRLQKNEFDENVWPANSAFFINDSTHCFETVQSLGNKLYF